MPEITLDGTPRTHDVGGGYQIVTGDIVGALNSGDSRGERSRGFFEDGFDALLEDAGLTRDKVIRIVPDDQADQNERGLSGTRTVTLHVPKDKELGSLVLVEDQATGAASWHLPAPSASRAVSPVATQRFDIPIDVTPAVSSLHERGFPRVPGVVLKVFTYPIGKIVKGFVRKWERTNRPYLIRSYTPANYTDSRKDFPALDADGWAHVSDGRALLFVHGTFSSSAAFSDLPSSVMERLSAQYGGRLFAFNHFTMTDEPATNATEFVDAVPEGVSLDVDIVCHSRGGLVARELVAQGAERGLRVGKVIFVGATNAGTTLADKEHLIKLLDRFTTFAKLLPGPVQTVVDAVAVALQVLAKSLLTELSGLQAMDPDGKYMKRLNVPGGQPIEGYAIASHFEPKPGTAWYKLTRIGDATVDAIFGQKQNDLVVPREGVFSGVNAAGFPISAERCLFFGDNPTGENDAVIHTQFFGQPRTHQAILSWLGAAAPRSVPDFESSSNRDGSVAVLEQLEALRPHVVNLSGGSLRKSGKYSTSPADVDAIFSEHLPQWMGAGGGGSGKPLRIVFFAHGGLINEQDGLG
nr:alpha/beta hydrolase [Gemmatimonadota bacterium]